MELLAPSFKRITELNSKMSASFDQLFSNGSELPMSKIARLKV